MDLAGRAYLVRIDLMYLGGTIPFDARDALYRAIADDLGDEAADLTIDVSSTHYSVVSVRVTMRGTSPLRAITRLDTGLDNVLMRIGMFEEFDVSGKTLSVEPDLPPHLR